MNNANGRLSVHALMDRGARCEYVWLCVCVTECAHVYECL